MSFRGKFSIKRSLLATVISLLVSPLLIYSGLCLIRPPRTDLPEQKLFKGIVYRRNARSQPRPLMLHIITIELTAPEIRVLVTPAKQTPEGMELPARITSKFLTEFKLQLAINANFFFPFHEHTPWDYYPHSGNMVNVLGQAITNGVNYSPVDSGWSVLCFSADKHAQIRDDHKCPEGTDQAVAGSSILVARGRPVLSRKDAADNRPLAKVAMGCEK